MQYCLAAYKKPSDPDPLHHKHYATKQAYRKALDYLKSGLWVRCLANCCCVNHVSLPATKVQHES